MKIKQCPNCEGGGEIGTSWDDFRICNMCGGLGEIRASKEIEFQAIYKEFNYPVYNWVRKYFSDPEQIKDIVQDVFIKVWNKFSLVQKSDNKSKYIHTIAKRTCLSWFSDRIARDERMQEEYFNQCITDGRRHADDVNHLRTAVISLPKQYRNAVYFAAQGYKPSEISAFMCLPTTTVNNRISYGTKLLNKKLNAKNFQRVI